MSDAKERPTFEIDGETYFVNPTTEEFIRGAGFKGSSVKRYCKYIEKAGIKGPAFFFNKTVKQMEEINGITKGTAKKLYQHAQFLKHQGKLVMDYDQLKERESEHVFLPTGSSLLDRMMTYADGNIGFRSRTMIELYGEPSMGKTQIALTAAAMCLRPKDKGGWGRAVAYIDSEGAFEGSRFDYLSRYWGVDHDFLRENLLYSRVTSFDDVETALNDIAGRQDLDLGLLVVDSIMDPLKAQYLVGGEHLSNLQPRQQHLKQVLDQMKFLAERHNAVVIYTNHIRQEINTGYSTGPDKGPQGGAVMGHASDIRISLDYPNKAERRVIFGDKKTSKNESAAKLVSLKAGRAKIVDCGFLPEAKGYFLIGPMGIADPFAIDNVLDQCEKIAESGYLCIDAEGNKIERIGDAPPDRDKQLEKIREQLYFASEEEDEEEEQSEEE